MKIAFNVRPVNGPWGGGNRFVKSLANALVERGDLAVFSLDDPDIDIALIVDPRPRNPTLAFSAAQALAHPRALIVHRINECDERKGSRFMNRRLRIANMAADQTVFIASWLQDLDVWRRANPACVILNGADATTFNSQGHADWDGRARLKLVTHHWGAHVNKGVDVYRFLGENADRLDIHFTYIGNLPSGLALGNARHIPPLDGQALAMELKRHHVYVTASLNEPAGMHHIEGALCALPVLYRQSGALPEYCHSFGVGFSGVGEIEAALRSMRADYGALRAVLPQAARTSEKMCQEYLALFDSMQASRDEIKARRRPLRRTWARLVNRLVVV